jgi:hypothetical protein
MAHSLRRAGLATLPLLLLAAACGDDGEVPATDQQAPEAAVLQSGDLPEGWFPTQPEEGGDPTADQIRTGMAECRGEEPALLASEATSAEAVFESPEGEVRSEVTYPEDADEAARAVAIHTGAEAERCLWRVIRGMAFGGSGDQVDLTIDERSSPEIPDGLGDAAAAVRVQFTATDGEQTLTRTVELWVVQAGRAGVTMTFQTNEDPFPRDEAERLTRLVVDRT